VNVFGMLYAHIKPRIIRMSRMSRMLAEADRRRDAADGLRRVFWAAMVMRLHARISGRTARLS
jgi:hypothetical protein